LSSATVSGSDRLCYRIAMFSLLCWKFIFRIPGMEWSCSTGAGCALFVCLFLSLVLQDYRIPVFTQLLVMIVIAERLSLLGFVFKPVSWQAGDSRLRQTFSLRIHFVERQSLSSICSSTIISCRRSLEASLSTSASRSIAGPIVFLLDRNKPVSEGKEIWRK